MLENPMVDENSEVDYFGDNYGDKGWWDDSLADEVLNKKIDVLEE